MFFFFLLVRLVLSCGCCCWCWCWCSLVTNTLWYHPVTLYLLPIMNRLILFFFFFTSVQRLPLFDLFLIRFLCLLLLSTSVQPLPPFNFSLLLHYDITSWHRIYCRRWIGYSFFFFSTSFPPQPLFELFLCSSLVATTANDDDEYDCTNNTDASVFIEFRNQFVLYQLVP